MTLLQLLKLLIPELSDTLAKASLYGTVALALVTCFFGYRLRQVWYSILVFTLGAFVGYIVARLFLPERTGLCLLIGFGVGALLSLFTFRVYQAVAFVLAFFSVFGLVGEALGDLYPVLALICALVLGVLAGILAARYQFAVVIAVTSVSGGWRAASLLRRCIPNMGVQTMLILAACLIGAGLLFQFLTAKKANKTP